MMNRQNLGSKEGVGVKFKEGVCAEFCLKLWIETDWYFCNITKSGWFWKRLSRKSPKQSLPKDSSEKPGTQDPGPKTARFTTQDIEPGTPGPIPIT